MSERGAGPKGLVAIVSGRGQLPRDLAETRATAGLPYLLIVFPDCWEDWMADHPHQHHFFEKAGALFRGLRQAKAKYIVFAGAMNRPKLRFWKADLKAVGLLLRATRLLGKGDDQMLRGFAAIFESEGLVMLSPEAVLGGDLLIAPGPFAVQEPSDQDKADAARAAAIVRALGPLDVGQGAVVAGGICLAVEAIEGTDLMLARLTELPNERRASAPPPAGVLYKGPKPEQDRRMDVPAIGPTTVEAAAAAGLNGIVAAAGDTMVMDHESTRAQLSRTGLFLYGATEEELQAWAR